MQRLGARVDRDAIEIETVDSPPSVPDVKIEDLRNAIAAENSLRCASVTRGRSAMTLDAGLSNGGSVSRETSFSRIRVVKA